MFWLFSFPVISFFQTFYALRDASVQMSVHYHPLAVFGTDECLVLVSCAGLYTPAPALVMCIIWYSTTLDLHITASRNSLFSPFLSLSPLLLQLYGWVICIY